MFIEQSPSTVVGPFPPTTRTATHYWVERFGDRASPGTGHLMAATTPNNQLLSEMTVSTADTTDTPNA